jgi:hypothetical protein
VYIESEVIMGDIVRIERAFLKKSFDFNGKVIQLEDIIFSSITLLYNQKQSVLRVEPCDLENSTVYIYCSSGITIEWLVDKNHFISNDGQSTQAVTVFINVAHENEDGDYNEDYYFPTKEKK